MDSNHLDTLSRAASPDVAPAPGGFRRRVLLVDDDELYGRALQGALSCLGFDAVAVTSPIVALGLVRDAPSEFGVVITEYAMPRMTALELVGELRVVAPGVSIAFHSRMPIESAHDVDRVISKPAPLADLAETLRELLDMARARSR